MIKKKSYFSLMHCLNLLNNNDIIAYPSESVFGLGCNPDHQDTILKLINLKNRNRNQGLILVASHYYQLLPYINETYLSIKEKSIMFSCWPGCITFLVPSQPNVSNLITGYSGLIAVRVTSHAILRNLCWYYGKPIISTSANISGMQPSKTPNEVCDFFGSDFPILDGNIGNFLYPSKIFNIITGECIRDESR
ncbi:Sua5/YciO/YrdC/YwlC family protein [Buchnera aphidicola]|uniref:Sua5/YciO/YrdC/YwlC family protein n=1 Tax=Buchnera aphidicola TaxID=9 RepID=UPI0034649061